MENFKESVAIVTGAASGIGRALGQELAQRGALVIMADIQTELLEEAVGSITQAGHKAEAVALDVTDFQAVKALVKNTAARHGTLDYIFNNAGIAVGGEVRDVSIDDWRDVLDVNLFGVVHGVAAAYPLMVKQGHGHIVNTASIAGLIPFPVEVSYVASKYGVVGLSNALRVEGADLGVNVSVVCPGLIKTPIFYTSKLIKIDREKMLKSLPERFIINPEECASVILRGVERNKAVIVVTGVAKVFWWLHRINPGSILWMMRRKIKEAREKMRIED
ncbi:MAG: SDR family oxidoreductase [Desulfobacteraceae bacterium]|jgi:NAD(P)-dependent dehydrogenase (short-subunit alcohol dehydrogenase family)